MEMVDEKSRGMSVRLLFSKKTGKIIYAEAEKDFVDLLLSFLSMPLGSVIKSLLASGGPKEVGSVTSLYVALEKLPAQYINGDKSKLLEPKLVSKCSCQDLPIDGTGRSFYICRKARPDKYNAHSVSATPNEICACGLALNCPVVFPRKACQSNSQDTDGGSSEGYVKDSVMFIITDDLNVTPSSTIASIRLLNQLKVKDLSEVEEKTASVGADKVIELLWASLVSTTPLNDVFSAVVPKPGMKRRYSS